MWAGAGQIRPAQEQQQKKKEKNEKKRIQQQSLGEIERV